MTEKWGGRDDGRACISDGKIERDEGMYAKLKKRNRRSFYGITEMIMGKLIFENFDQKIEEMVHGAVIDFSHVTFLDPWAIATVGLLLAEHHNDAGKRFILPQDKDVLGYLCRLHFNELLSELGYIEEGESLRVNYGGEKENMNLHEMIHCRTKDELEGRLHRFIRIFENFGMDSNDARTMTAIVGELGNNVFDHNLGNWPTDSTGCIILAQRYGGNVNRIQVVIADFGSGFLASLKPAYPELKSDVDAIRKGLAGFTGRLGEKRGNGLKTIQAWTIDKFRGTLSIHSGSGMANVNASGIETKEFPRTMGTVAQLMIEC